jgi:chemotaxis response regulator CheB
MPRVAAESGLADAVLPLDQIADMIAKTVRVG